MKIRALKELAKTGNAEVREDEIERVADWTHSTAYALGYVYARTHIDQMFDPPEVPTGPATEDEDVIGYIEGWCDAQYENTREEFGMVAAEKNAHYFTSNKFDYLDILRFYTQTEEGMALHDTRTVIGRAEFDHMIVEVVGERARHKAKRYRCEMQTGPASSEGDWTNLDEALEAFMETVRGAEIDAQNEEGVGDGARRKEKGSTMHGSMTRQSKDERQAMILEALDNDTEITALAERYGVHRTYVHRLVKEAKQDPEGKLQEAEAEATFRRRVLELLEKSEEKKS